MKFWYPYILAGLAIGLAGDDPWRIVSAGLFFGLGMVVFGAIYDEK